MQFRLPDVGEGITEAVLVKWHVKPGQLVTEDDTLCEIETDKALVEIPAPCAGIVVSLDVAEGVTVAVGSVIAEVRGPDTDADDAAVEPVPAVMPLTAETRDKPSLQPGPRADAAPSVQRLARELRVDLSRVSGSGPNGRILQADVESAARKGAKSESMPREADERTADRVALSGLRKAIAEKMTRSSSLIPHATSAFRCDATAFVECRERLRSRFGPEVSYTAMVMKMMVPVLEQYPYFNSTIDDTAQEIVTFRAQNIGFATATDEGLMVPVVRDVARKSISEISVEMKRLAAEARERKIKLNDLRGGTITLSNIGSHGGHETGGQPIINYPQAAIIVMNRIRPEPSIHNGVVCPRMSMSIITSYDHRLIDGAYASACIEYLIALIESPATLQEFA